MALAKCVGVKSNLGRKDFFIIFSLHAKKNSGLFEKNFLFAHQNFQKKEGRTNKRKQQSERVFIHFLSNARNSGFRKK